MSPPLAYMGFGGREWVCGHAPLLELDDGTLPGIARRQFHQLLNAGEHGGRVGM